MSRAAPFQGHTLALAGNPNVGKSTIFNALTGLKQHTGNWPGKTVSNAQGYFSWKGQDFRLTDVPGCYSLLAHSQEEEVARDYICFGGAEGVMVVCDGTCLERNLNLVLQILEVTSKVVVAVNLMDEAKKKGIQVDLAGLEARLGVRVLGTAARQGSGVEALMEGAAAMVEQGERTALRVEYPPYIETAVGLLEDALEQELPECFLPRRWVALRLLEGDTSILMALNREMGVNVARKGAIFKTLEEIFQTWAKEGREREKTLGEIAATVVTKAAEIAGETVKLDRERATRLDRRLDRLFTSRSTGFPIMLLLLLGIFWLTMAGANYPSRLLSHVLFGLEAPLANGLTNLGVAPVAVELLVHGAYRVVAWVVAVMLPPMAIFFPLFTLLEDFGYLPRVAFNLDKCFQGCRACGKQALTMCMGLGCNAVGVTGCRIIDSPRERLIAILTNALVPCNGRLPTMVTLITLFLVGSSGSLATSLGGAAVLVAVMVLGVGMTLLASKLLSGTILKGEPSSFALELPPYRRPQVWKVIVRSVVDRTLKVLARAVIAAAPAGVLIWVLANVKLGNVTLLATLTGALDPVGRWLGMDGVILTAFLLGLPANEIVLPIIIMSYLSQGSLTELSGAALLELLGQNGWTAVTAVCVILFSLMHWPCATTCMTIYQETKSVKWTALAVVVPTALGVCGCLLVNGIARWI